MIESWKAKLSNQSKFGVIIMDLAKTYDSLNCDLLLAKLEADGLDNNAVIFLRNYLTNKLQRCKINSFSKWAKICAGVPQRSTVGPLLFNIFISDIFGFLQKCDLANYADDCNICASDNRVSTIIDSLSHEFTILSKWFYKNFMVVYLDKC